MASQKTETGRPAQTSGKHDTQFRAIGPAAIVAALLWTAKKNKPGLALSTKAT